MKNIKDITISIFAIIGFVFILSSFNIQAEPQETHSTVPASHVWEGINDASSQVYIYNKVTGEARCFYSTPKIDRGYLVLKPDN
tara:strand:- start:302 stop:553 length:252 start_codon:yes stop_codon:yes gene_type:complete